MKLAIVVSYAPSLLNFRGPFIREAIRRGYEVVAFAPDFENNTVSKQLHNWGVQTQRYPLSRRGLSPLSDLKSMWILHNLYKKHQPDVILSFTAKPNIWSGFAAALAGIRSVACVTGLGYLFSQEGARSFKVKLAQKVGLALYKGSNRYHRAVIFQNPDDMQDFIAAGVLHDHTKVRMVHGSGVDLTHYTPDPLPQSPVFLMISRLLGDKGVREYAAAALRIKDTHPQVRCLLVGYLDQGPDSVSQAELDAWIAGGLEFLGRLNDVRCALSQCSVYVLPSYREGTPRSVLEAMAMARPVITTDAPGCRETVVNGENGYLVPVKDVDLLYKYMEMLLQDPELCASMGQAGLVRAQDRYDVTKVNEVMFKHIESVL